MAKKIIRLTENELAKAIHSSIKELESVVLNERSNTLLVEMARINTNDGGLFPFNSFEVKIWSNDHNPPHSHIIKDGWDVSFLIDDGEMLEIKTQGNKKDVYNYMIKNVKQWLSEECAVLPAVSNKDNAMAVWKQIH